MSGGNQADRDARTVEIGYALVSAGFLGALVFGVIAGPAAVWSLPHRVSTALVLTGAGAAGLLAVVRVVHVLRSYERGRRAGDGPGRSDAAGR
ncbi:MULTISPECIES: DUF6332 family protein [unclassified Streptomyces]|uniref:DUF6332 family protein n=1 Tax=unclassified Streptomyces TaxID=2593676 RepID=UPI002E12884C|nr:DUF6332 family protein [Streptomyces sp. NBC_01197]WSS47360.1 DUF6332 family protein [Streptomyces sp. NBC_01180]